MPKAQHYDLHAVIDGFLQQGSFQESRATGDGHINDTYIVTTTLGDEVFYYIVQRINHHVFQKPWEVMENIIQVTEHIQHKLYATAGDVLRGTLRFIQAKTGQYFVIDRDGNYWRCYHYVDGARSYRMLENAQMFYHVGKGFGLFQQYLSDYPAETLHETIPMFHHTRNRYKNFLHAIEMDAVGRGKTVQAEIAQLLNWENLTGLLLDQHAQGILPLRVTHNDTKVNNVLLDDVTKEAVCVIDLDTVMPGLAAYDFGDAIRVGASTAEEDERDLSKVDFDLDLFEAFTKGFLNGTGGLLTSAEVNSLPTGALVMTLENALRFLTDYLNGDTYFKIAYADHNLVRCRTQIRMVERMEANWDKMQNIMNR